MKKVRHFIKNTILVFIVVSMLFSAFSCKNLQEQSGELEEGYEPKIEGTVTVSSNGSMYSNDMVRKGIRNWISMFNSKYPNVSVKEDFSTVDVTVRVASKDIGDVFAFADTQVYDYAVTNKALMPLDSYVNVYDIKMGDVYAGFQNLGFVDGQLYMIATYCGQHTFTYNADALSSAGLKPPEDDWTWNDFKDYCKKLTLRAPDGTVTQAGACMNIIDSPMYIPFFVGWGGQWCDTVSKKITLYDDPLVLKGFQELIGALDNDWIYPKNPSVLSGTPKAAVFGNVGSSIYANSVFVQLAGYQVLSISGSEYRNLGLNWNVVAFPTFDYAATPCGTTGYGVFKYTNNPDTAAALALSLYTEDGQIAFNGETGGGGVPLLSTLAGDDFWHLEEEGYENVNYNAFIANTDRYIPSQVKCEVPNAVAEIIVKGMEDLFRAYYSGSSDWKDQLNKIQTSANEKWSTLSIN